MINEFELAKQVASIGERVDYVAGRITDLGKTLVDHEQWLRKVAHKADHVELLHNHQAADADDLYLLTERVAKLEGHTDWNRSDARDDLNGLAERVKKLEEQSSDNELAPSVNRLYDRIEALEGRVAEAVDAFAEDTEGLAERVKKLEESGHAIPTEYFTQRFPTEDDLRERIRELEAVRDRLNERLAKLEERCNELLTRAQEAEAEVSEWKQKYNAAISRDANEVVHPSLTDRYGNTWEWVQGYVNVWMVSPDEDVLSLERVDDEAGPLKVAQ